MTGQQSVRKVWYKRMWIYGIGAVVLAVLLYLGIQGIRCAGAVSAARKSLASYGALTAQLSSGAMSYVDKGEGEVILSVHGIFGGYDQAYQTCAGFGDRYRILAPSRFGYLGSDLPQDASPMQQAKAYAELLDALGIDKVYVLATSAGGSVAIQFALHYPERTKGLILYCSSVPPLEKPDDYAAYAGPPAALCNDYAMFLASPFFDAIMGMAPSTIYSMLPCADRKDGIVNDAAVTNPDMNRHYDLYPVETLQVPTILFHAKDDKLAPYDAAAAARFPQCTSVIFEDGGHLMAGHGEEIRQALTAFMEAQRCAKSQPYGLHMR